MVQVSSDLPENEPERKARSPLSNDQDDAAITLKEYLHDIRRMLAYCRSQGLALSDVTAKDVANLLDNPVSQPKLNDVLRVHGQLSASIAPATPRSLAATEFSLRDTRAIVTYLLLSFLIVASVLGLVGYVLTLPPLPSPPNQNSESLTPSRKELSTEAVSPSLRLISAATNVAISQNLAVASQTLLSIQLNFLFAAMLGAAFNGLLTAYRYFRDRSFDPGYVAVYVIRFVVGLLAGVVLANLGSELFRGNDTLAKLGPGIIALLGGYSAEAVRQILDRLVEVLVTVVRGKDTTTDARLGVAKDVLSVAQAAAANPNTPPDVKDKLDALLKKLQK